MVSHSSSASLSSFPFSHTSSSSPSSPPSSPDSLHDSFGASSASSSLALVPFLWEEKPGVLKKGIQMSDGGCDQHDSGEGGPSAGHPPFSSTHTGDSHVHSSKRLSRAFPASRSKVRSESVPRLRPPPCMSQPSVHAYVPAEDEADMLHHWGSSSGVRSKVMSSLSFHNKRRHYRTPSLEDDPFWMAMVACTNDEGKGSRMRFKGDRDKVSKNTHRSDSCHAKTMQGRAIHFEQCMPRQSFASCTDSDREKSQASSRLMSSKNGAGRHVAHDHTQHDCTDMSAHSAHLASKAFKALNIAKSELHGRCKGLLQQQSSPVDISCSARRAKRPAFASKRKLPDLFGCKSNHPVSMPP